MAINSKEDWIKKAIRASKQITFRFNAKESSKITIQTLTNNYASSTKEDLKRKKPNITIVVSTYNRADALTRTIRCAIAQSVQDWKMLVIGDACTDHTFEKVAGFKDERIHFVNLPERFGEQAGPNSVGMMLAESEFIAFLNHDDLWLPNHLALAMSRLNETKADIYWSCAAFFKNRGPRFDLPIFVESSPTNRVLEDAYAAPRYYAEPMSSWVINTASSRKLGHITLSSMTPITPLQDYTIRASQMGLTLTTGKEITVLKDNMRETILPGEKRPKTYSLDNEYSEHLVQLIEKKETSMLKEKIHIDLWLAKHMELDRSFEQNIPQGQGNPYKIFLKTGVDLVRLKGKAQKNGFMGILSNALENRTGEKLTNQPDITEMIRFAKEKLESVHE